MITTKSRSWFSLLTIHVRCVDFFFGWGIYDNKCGFEVNYFGKCTVAIMIAGKFQKRRTLESPGLFPS